MPRRAIHLDGRTLEGGGQLVRLATCLAALNNRPVRVTDIRGNRGGGGGLKLVIAHLSKGAPADEYAATS
jgi:RNA 3'-terminal phosphate cyclase (ATP)